MRNNIICVLLCAVLFASCASHKSVSDTAGAKAPAATSTVAFFDNIVKNAVNTENIVGNASVSIKLGSKDITVPGALRMRKDKVIRIQLFVPILGTEIGRIEFTPDHVLVVDRMSREYVMGDYNKIDFLRDNGITFYSLQALFWNQLIIPGKSQVTRSDADKYIIELDGNPSYVPLTLTKGKMNYKWNALRTDKTLTSAVITYNSTESGTSMLSWFYSNFTAVEGKQFPRTQEFNFQTVADGKRQEGNIKIDMNSVKTSSKWDAETVLSPKYRRINAENVLSRIMKF
jgi:hypothetical protein